MPETKPSTDSGSVGTEVAKGAGGLLLIAAFVYFVKWLIVKLLWLWAKVKLGFFTLGKALVLLGALTVFAFLVALICDALAPLINRIKKDREKQRAIASCRLPSLTAFRTGHSELENEQTARIDTFLARLLRERYLELTGSLPDRNTFRNSTTYHAFKSGELPSAVRRANQQIEQDVLSPLIAAYRTGSFQIAETEENP